MTAKRSAISVIPAQPRWRLAWAARENHHRQRAYDMDVETWRRRDDELVRLRFEAAGFLGCLEPRTGLPVDLDHDEVVYRVLPAAELVEAKARHTLGLPAPGLSIGPAGRGAPDLALPAGLRIVDSGLAVVTNHRVAFAGHHSRREWRYPDVVGPAHHPSTSLTLLHTTDGSQLAGLLVPTAAMVNVRFYLTLAFATATGRRATVAAEVETLLHAHRNSRPVAPPPAEPDHAPLRTLPPGRLVTAAAVVAFACATLAAGTSEPGPHGPPHRAQPSPVGIGTHATDPPGTSTPTNPASATAPDPGTNAPPTVPAAARGTGGAADPASPAPDKETARRTVAASPVVATLPTVRPTPTPTTPPAPTTDPTPAPTPSPTEVSPTTTPPPDGGLLDLCLNPLRLPLAERLLCP